MSTAQPYWWDAAPPASQPPLDVLPASDVAIVGAGYTGLSAAITLARAGRSVQVFDHPQRRHHQRQYPAHLCTTRQPLRASAGGCDHGREQGGTGGPVPLHRRRKDRLRLQAGWPFRRRGNAGRVRDRCAGSRAPVPRAGDRGIRRHQGRATRMAGHGLLLWRQCADGHRWNPSSQAPCGDAAARTGGRRARAWRDGGGGDHVRRRRLHGGHGARHRQSSPRDRPT
jgi:hypothetical protein